MKSRVADGGGDGHTAGYTAEYTSGCSVPGLSLRLELASFPVTRAQFGSRTAYDDGVLTIDRAAALDLLAREPAFASVGLDLAHPGERVRLVHALDAVAPLLKVAGPGCAYPGFLGPPRLVGHGRTHRLEGLAVIVSTPFPQPMSGVQSFEEGFIDMSGPAAQFCACSDTANVVLLPRAAGVANATYDHAVRLATLRLARYLAETTREARPAGERVYKLAAAPGLPRVAALFQIRNQGLAVQSFLYGHHLANLVPTALHPNELLDGALVNGHFRNGTKTPTLLYTCHPLVTTLYERHGRDLAFAGVILARGHWETQELKERTAQLAAQLALALGLDGVVLNQEGTGNSTIDYMLTVQALERVGVRTVAMVHEYGGPDGADPPLIDFVPEADALVSIGGIDRRVLAAPMERAIGGDVVVQHRRSAVAEQDVPLQELYAATAALTARGWRAAAF